MENAYRVEARLDLPDFAAEHRYVVMETGLAEQEMAKCPRWLPFSYPDLGILRGSDWQRYIRELERYGRELERNEHEARQGLWPLVFVVINDAGQPDTNVRIRLKVENGQVLPKHKSPTRPHRVDGAPEQSSDATKLLRTRGFVRRHVRITAHAVEAEFSRLEAHDNARLLGQTLYLDARRGLRVRFEVNSRNGDGQGEVRLPHRSHDILRQN